jgi:hypothetical protein
LCLKICKSGKDCIEPSKPICIQGECVPPACSADVDCPDQKCCSGDCKTDCGYGVADSCTITSIGGVVAVGGTRALNAVGTNGDLTRDGMLIPGTQITWNSSNTGIATVDAYGVLTGISAGTAEITARTGSIKCRSGITCTVIAPSTETVKVHVYDEASGTPVEGAQVKVGAAAFRATDKSGIAGFDIAANDGTVHVMKNGYTWVSYVGSAKPGYIIFIRRNASDSAGGFRGAFDFSPIKKDDQLHAGIAAMSVGDDSLLSMDLGTIFGGMIQTPVKISSPFVVNGCVSLPGGLTGGSNYLKVPDLIPEFRITGDTGLHAVWGFGTVLNTGDITDILKVPSCILCTYNNEVNWTKLITFFLPYAFNMNHAVLSALDVAPVPKVKTPEITCPDGKKAKLVDSDTVADYEGFKQITLSTGTKMRLSSLITAAELPRIGGDCLKNVVAIGGADLPGMGFVPLGMTAGAAPDDGRNCKITWDRDGNPFILSDNQLLLRMAPNHDGMEGSRYSFTLLAFDFNKMGANTSNPTSALVLRGENRVSQTYDLTARPFMGFAEGTSLNRATREITTAAAAVKDAAFYRYDISGNGGCQVYSDRTSGATITLPKPPEGMTDVLNFDAGMKVYAISTNGSASLGNLFSDTGAVHINDLMSVVNAYSSITCVDASKCKDDTSCNTACELK